MMLLINLITGIASHSTEVRACAMKIPTILILFIVFAIEQSWQDCTKRNTLNDEPLSKPRALLEREAKSYVEIFEHANNSGKHECIYPLAEKSVNGCEDLSDWWQGLDNGTTTKQAPRVSSVNPHGTCVKLYSQVGCEGEHFLVAPGTSHHSDLKLANFDDKTRSIGTCLSQHDLAKYLAMCDKFDGDLFYFFGNKTRPKEFEESNVKDALTKFEKVMSGLSLAASIVAAPLAPLFGLFGFVGGMFKDYGNPKVRKQKGFKIDVNIAEGHAIQLGSYILHCKEQFEGFDKHRRFSDYKSTIEICHHNMASKIKDFESDLFRREPLVTGPYLVAFVPVFLVMQDLMHAVDLDQLKTLEKEASALVNILRDYARECPERRYHAEFPNATVPAAQGPSFCRRNWKASAARQYKDYFKESIELAESHRFMLTKELEARNRTMVKYEPPSNFNGTPFTILG